MAASNGSQVSSIPWRRLRAWVDEQEAWEKAHNEPAPLTNNQAVAISSLVPLIEEPDVAGTNFVGSLQEFLQARNLTPPVWSESPVNLDFYGIKLMRWRVCCQVGDPLKSFPCEGYGYEPGQQAPMFQSKKNAKQFAARQALTFLTSVGMGNTAPRAATASTAQTTATAPTPSAASTVATAPSPIPAPGAQLFVDPDEDRGKTIFQTVTELANDLGFRHPVYKIEKQSQDAWDLWKGYADFREDAGVPVGLGAVNNILGQKSAKLAVAGKVLDWLRAQEQLRKEQFANVSRAAG